MEKKIGKISSTFIIDTLKEGKNLTLTSDYGSMIINADELSYELITKDIRIKYYFDKNYKVINYGIR